jgi:short-subunit dehydrogenase
MRERYGEWALITGASAGLGAEYARALAKEGVSCVLTARREERLRALADELERTHGVATRVVTADLTDPAGTDVIIDAVRDLEIAILVNNAGFGYAGRFDKQEAARLKEMVIVNCLAPVALTSAFAPAMRARGRGAILMLGSVAGSQPLPLHALYSATKVFDNYLGEALWSELRTSGVDVLTVQPGPTATEFATVAGETREPGEPPEDVVALSLARLGWQPSVVSGWFNWIRAQAFRLVPRSILTLAAHEVVTTQTPVELR